MKRSIVAAAAATAALACAGAPMAGAAPTRGYAVFTQCPTRTAQVDGCLYAPVESGYITLGKTAVPITKTLVVQGGLLEEEEVFVKHVAGALDGETLTRVGQTVPGGLFGSPLHAVTELAGPANSITVNDRGAGGLSLSLPIKVRLVTPLLGAECTIGTNAHPIDLTLTTGTSGGLTGNPSKQTTIEEGGIALKSGVVLVNGGFAAPKATNCGSAVTDEALDAKLGIPSNNNKIVFDLKVEIANSELVEESEG